MTYTDLTITTNPEDVSEKTTEIVDEIYKNYAITNIPTGIFSKGEDRSNNAQIINLLNNLTIASENKDAKRIKSYLTKINETYPDIVKQEYLSLADENFKKQRINDTKNKTKLTTKVNKNLVVNMYDKIQNNLQAIENIYREEFTKTNPKTTEEFFKEQVENPLKAISETLQKGVKQTKRIKRKEFYKSAEQIVENIQLYDLINTSKKGLKEYDDLRNQTSRLVQLYKTPSSKEFIKRKKESIKEYVLNKITNEGNELLEFRVEGSISQNDYLTTITKLKDIKKAVESDNKQRLRKYFPNKNSIKNNANKNAKKKQLELIDYYDPQVSLKNEISDLIKYS